MKGTKPYRIWKHIKQRCLNKNSKDYSNYGGRGITICDDWLEFSNFWKDMQDGFDDTLSIDRIDNNRGYCKNNCRWATAQEQANNKRNNRLYLHQGKWQSVSAIARRHNINVSVLFSRVNNGWGIDKAVTKPVQRKVVLQ